MSLPIDQRDALQVLARSPLGTTESIMMAYGFGVGTLQKLVRDGLATAERRTVQAGRPIAVKWLEITDAGRAALARISHTTNGLREV
jgi:DNA-binding PadR family transcriptional regulator